MRLLLADKDEALADALASEWQTPEHEVVCTGDGASAECLAANMHFDALVLNWELRRLPGDQVLANLRASRNPVPVMMLSDDPSLERRVWALNTGADDFMSRPLAVAEVQARLRAILRRSGARPDPHVTYGELHFNRDTLCFRVEDAHLRLTPREHTALVALMEKAGHAVTRQVLVQRVFSADAGCDGIEVVMHRLRKKLIRAAVTVETCRGIGYRLIERAPRQERAESR